MSYQMTEEKARREVGGEALTLNKLVVWKVYTLRVFIIQHESSLDVSFLLPWDDTPEIWSERSRFPVPDINSKSVQLAL